jgi:hypothetical protein
MLDGDRRFSVCEQGRVHTNVANLPRQYRRFIRLGGCELASVDVSTSQPLLLALLIARGGITQTGVAAMHKYCWGRAGGGPSTLPPTSPSASAFLRDCLAGGVYDRISDHTGYSRGDVKPLFLAVVYGEPRHMGTKVGDAIRELYPDVFDAVVEANFRLGHGGLPRLMQAMESRVMIGRGAARLLRERPRMPLLTVHDCVLVPPECVADAAAVIAEEWDAEFGVRPRTKRSDFTAPQEPRSRQRHRQAYRPV